MCQSSEDQLPSATNETLSPGLLQLVPPDPASQAALQISRTSLPAPVFNHSLRVYIYAKAFSEELKSSNLVASTSVSDLQPVWVQPATLFAACMFHDLTIIDKYDEHPARFEVVAADELVDLLRQHSIDETEIREAWLALSLHTTPGVAERISGTVGAVRRAIKADFGSGPIPSGHLSKEDVALVENELPRLNIEKILGDAVVRQAVKRREKAPSASWPGALLQAHDKEPSWDGVNKAF